MKSIILRIGPAEVTEALIDTAVEILLDNGVMVYPTETFYGIGAMVSSKKAVRRVYRLKKREAKKALPLIVSDIEMVEEIAAPPPLVFFRLASEFWPGPLTLVLKASESFAALNPGSCGTVAVRIPPVPWLRVLAGEIGSPLTATSANLSGQAEISDAVEAISQFEGKVDLIVDGGKTPGGEPSTIVDLSTEVPRILREGAIPAGKLAPFLRALQTP